MTPQFDRGIHNSTTTLPYSELLTPKWHVSTHPGKLTEVIPVGLRGTGLGVLCSDTNLLNPDIFPQQAQLSAGNY